MSKDISVFLSSAADGDMDAFGELYSLLSARVFNYARAITKSKEMSEDIAHDVFVQMLTRAAQLANVPNPVAYIMVSVRNTAYDHLRSSERKAAPLDEAPEVSAGAQPLDRLLILDAFSRLPPEQRETVYLQHVCGFTQREVADIMGVPLVTVKWRCGKAISKIKSYFNHTDEEERIYEIL